ncbi:MAG: 3-dehydroquinate synthase [Bacteroidia bacterium]
MQLKSAGYYVYFEKTQLTYLNAFLKEQTPPTLFMLCDTNTQKHCLPILLKEIKVLKNAKVYTIPSGEKHKSLETVTNCWNFLLKHKADRNALLICVGGGVVCDVGGFVASTYKRGISFINIPTTLLAMADASVGGKNGIDFNGYKNMVGTITQPKGVFIYEGFLQTISEREIKNGFAEIIKAALVGDATLWKKLISLDKLPTTKFSSFIYDAVLVKNNIVLKDPKEATIRQTLNFGHTVGHAMEAYYVNNKNHLLHGEAIVMGMCVELCLGKILNLTSAKVVNEVVLFLKKHYTLQAFSEKEVKSFLILMQQDKKNNNSKFRFALIEKVAKPIINISASMQDVKNAFVLYNNLL